MFFDIQKLKCTKWSCKARERAAKVRSIAILIHLPEAERHLERETALGVRFKALSQVFLRAWKSCFERSGLFFFCQSGKSDRYSVAAIPFLHGTQWWDAVYGVLKAYVYPSSGYNFLQFYLILRQNRRRLESDRPSSSSIVAVGSHSDTISYLKYMNPMLIVMSY